METTNTATELITKEEALSMLGIAYRAFSSIQPSMSRTFMRLGGQHLEIGSVFSSRGVYNTFKMDYYKYMDYYFTNPDSENNAVDLYGIDKVTKYLEALNEVVCDTPELKKLVDSYMGESDIKEPVTVVAAEPVVVPEVVNDIKTVPADVPQTKNPVVDAVIPEPPVVEQPTHGLLLDIDAVIRQQCSAFLSRREAAILNKIQADMKAELLNNTLVVLPAHQGPVKQTIIKGRMHHVFEEALEVTLIEGQAYFGGPTGSGKTTLAEQIAEAMGLPFGHISCTAGMSEAHLLGRMIADGSYIPSRLVELYENGGVFLVDEVDAADPNTTLILNSALANGILSVPNRKGNPVAKRHPEFYMIAAANTWGNGSSEYNGRNIQDGAFMDRFAMSKVDVDYDIALEKDILNGHADFAKKLWQIRESLKKNRVKKHLSTRVFAAAARAFAKGKTEEQILNRFFIGWAAQEVEKALLK